MVSPISKSIVNPQNTEPDTSSSWAVNHLSHFLLATTLLPLMQKTREMPKSVDGDVRIVMQSSELHRSSPFKVEFKTEEEVNDNSRDPNIL